MERPAEREAKRYEDYAYVLDFLPKGKPGPSRGFIAEPVVQLLGQEFFTLLEAGVRPNVAMNIHERVYIGKERRDKISHIIARILLDDLTLNAKSELPVIVEELVRQNEKKFVDFFNRAQAITMRMHAFELLPGIGKKYMWQIVNEREKKNFESFADIQKRTPVHDPVRVIVRRVLDELTGHEKYRVFTRPF